MIVTSESCSLYSQEQGRQCRTHSVILLLVSSAKAEKTFTLCTSEKHIRFHTKGHSPFRPSNSFSTSAYLLHNELLMDKNHEQKNKKNTFATGKKSQNQNSFHKDTEKSNNHNMLVTHSSPNAEWLFCNIRCCPVTYCIIFFFSHVDKKLFQWLWYDCLLSEESPQGEEVLDVKPKLTSVLPLFYTVFIFLRGFSTRLCLSETNWNKRPQQHSGLTENKQRKAS